MNQLIGDKVRIQTRPFSETLAILDERVARELGLLLKAAPPTREKVHQLICLLQDELPDSYSNLRTKIYSYYSIPFERRTPAEFQRQFGVRPYPWLHEQFILNFSSAHFHESDLSRAMRLFRYKMASALGAPVELTSTSIIFSALSLLVRPTGLQPKIGLRLMEFTNAWEKVARRTWGDRYDGFFKSLRVQTANVILVSQNPHARVANLTQTDVDWLKDILKALNGVRPLPAYPLSRGPGLGATLQIEKLVRGHNQARFKFGQSRELLAIQTAIARECLRLLNLVGQAVGSDLWEHHSGRVG